MKSNRNECDVTIPRLSLSSLSDFLFVHLTTTKLMGLLSASLNPLPKTCYILFLSIRLTKVMAK